VACAGSSNPAFSAASWIGKSSETLTFFSIQCHHSCQWNDERLNIFAANPPANNDAGATFEDHRFVYIECPAYRVPTVKGRFPWGITSNSVSWNDERLNILAANPPANNDAGANFKDHRFVYIECPAYL
jgi:hypothetical protein